MKTVIIDTNFLLMPGQLKVDIYSEIDRLMQGKYELAVLDRTLQELENLTHKGTGADKRAAKLGMSLLKAKGLKIITTNQDIPVDDLIVNLAKKDIIVATQDKGLRARLKGKGVHLIVLRSQKKLVLEEA